MKVGKADYSRPKSIVLSGEDMREIDSLIFSQLFQDRMPTNVKKKRNKMVLWAVKELDRVLREGIKSQQTYLEFNNNEVT